MEMIDLVIPAIFAELFGRCCLLDTITLMGFSNC